MVIRPHTAAKEGALGGIQDVPHYGVTEYGDPPPVAGKVLPLTP